MVALRLAAVSVCAVRPLLMDLSVPQHLGGASVALPQHPEAREPGWGRSVVLSAVEQLRVGTLRLPGLQMVKCYPPGQALRGTVCHAGRCPSTSVFLFIFLMF